MKPYLCRDCGETDKEYFYSSNKSKCRCCILGISKENYHPHQVIRELKPCHCIICGETDNEKFYSTVKNCCKECMKNSRSKHLSGKKRLAAIRKRSETIKKKIKSTQHTILRITVLHKDIEGNLIKKYSNTLEAALAFNCSQTNIKKYYSKGLRWKDGTYLECGEKERSATIIDPRERQNPQEFFEQTVIANHGDVYGFDKAIYCGSEEDVELRCKKHGNYFKVKAVTMLRRTERNGGNKKNPIVGSCPICREEYFAGIKENILNKCRLVHNNEYEYGEYVNMDTPLVIICKKHGEFKVMPRTHSEGGGKCPQCHIHCKVSRSEKIKYVGEQKYYICEIHGDVPIGNGRNASEGCPTCNVLENNRIQEEILRNNLESRFGENYDIFITEKYVEFRCKKHGNRITFKRNELNVGNRGKKRFCIDCQKDDKKAEKENKKQELKTKCQSIVDINYSHLYAVVDFIDDENLSFIKVRLSDLINGGEKIFNIYSVINNLISIKGSVPIIHVSFNEAKVLMRKLGITSLRQYKNWKNRTTQPTLPSNPHRTYKEWVSHYDFFGTNSIKDMSAGELRIKDYLERKNIEYVFQKRYADCRDKNPLPFDFYLPEYNLIIEFDGYQHYYEVKKFGKLEVVQKHDAIKNKYCGDNGINIIRIPYWELEDNVVEWTLDNEITRVAAERHILV